MLKKLLEKVNKEWGFVIVFLVIVLLIVWVALLYIQRDGANDLDIEGLHQENEKLTNAYDSLTFEIECAKEMISSLDSVIDVQIAERDKRIKDLKNARYEIYRLKNIADYDDDESIRYFEDSVLPALEQRYGHIISGDSL